MSKDASVISYAPANTLILTDAATNIRKDLSNHQPARHCRTEVEVGDNSLNHATAAEVQKIIQDLYGSGSRVNRFQRGRGPPLDEETVCGTA